MYKILLFQSYEYDNAKENNYISKKVNNELSGYMTEY